MAEYGDEWSLYNMEEDRTELNDLANEHPEIVRDLAAKYNAWAERSNVRPWSDVLRIREQLRSRK